MPFGVSANSIRINIAFQQKLGLSRLILSGGMPRSGSTLLFNILRLALSQGSEKKVSAGWVYDIDQLPDGKIYLIKLHHINWLRALRASQIFYSYRDIRDALVSYSRKSGQPTIEVVRRWVADFQWAERNADRMIRHEQLTDDLEGVVTVLLEDLGVDASVEEVLSQLPSEAPSETVDGRHCMETLFHVGHRTNTKTGEWRNVLDSDFLDHLHSEFDWWFTQNGYDAD